MNDPTALGISVPGNESAATPDTRIRRFCAAEITVLPDDDPQPFYCEETSSGVISLSEVHV